MSRYLLFKLVGNCNALEIVCLPTYSIFFWIPISVKISSKYNLFIFHVHFLNTFFKIRKNTSLRVPGGLYQVLIATPIPFLFLSFLQLHHNLIDISWSATASSQCKCAILNPHFSSFFLVLWLTLGL